jgi:hypothetical protein
MSGYGKRINTVGFWSGAKHRLLSFALFALLIQATIPYFVTNCPMYSAGITAVKSSSAASNHQVMADCPLMTPHQHAAVPDGSNHGDQHGTVHGYCSLCAALSSLNAFVVAGLIALPPPSPRDAPQFFATAFQTLPTLQASAFSARAPPLST